MLATFFEMMRGADVTAIETSHGLPASGMLVSWIRSLNHVRNICAHHGRLWNPPFIIQPRLPERGSARMLDHLREDRLFQTRIYAAAAIVQFLLRTINPSTTWKNRLTQLVDDFPAAAGVDARQMGFPREWRQMSLWQ